MVATRDFSGLVSSSCALASAAASDATDSLDRCMTALYLQEIEAHRAGLGALGANPMADRLLGVLRHQGLEFGLGLLVLEEGRPGRAEHRGKLSPGIGGGHVDDADGRNARAGRLDPKEARGLATLHAAPELLLRRQQEVLVEAIGRNGNLDPL